MEKPPSERHLLSPLEDTLLQHKIRDKMQTNKCKQIMLKKDAIFYAFNVFELTHCYQRQASAKQILAVCTIAVH